MISKTCKENIRKVLLYIRENTQDNGVVFINAANLGIMLWGEKQLLTHSSIQGLRDLASHMLNYLMRYGLIVTQDFRIDIKTGGRYYSLTYKGSTYLEKLEAECVAILST